MARVRPPSAPRHLLPPALPPAPPPFNDTADDCAICLSPLAEAPVITLPCGHVWHTACVRAQLTHARPDPARRLAFAGTACAKCGAWAEHPALRDVAAVPAAVRQAVDRLLVERLGPDADLDAARREAAFYLCSACEAPFFGGTAACAREHDRDALPPDERVCPACTVSVACAGRPACVQPLPAGRSTHRNGPDPACEQLYACGACTSSGQDGGRGGAAAAAAAPATSRNLLVNPSAAAGTAGWHVLRALGQAWSTEASAVPLSPGVRRNFVSTYITCVMAQVVDLSAVVRRPGEVVLSVAAAFSARTDCSSWYTLEAALYDGACGELQYRTTGRVPAPADCWMPATHELGPAPAARYVVICLRGADDRGWAGDYGSKATDCACRVRLGGVTEADLLADAPAGGGSGGGGGGGGSGGGGRGVPTAVETRRVLAAFWNQRMVASRHSRHRQFQRYEFGFD
ncbi:hypothetical protein BU14_0166s0036 [Porphyra umbilicalis]|uniref:RING-type domain-containing protein n=1 Tax=Porphyra umbilicalis TaxID=2786 RepID=A0A1X6P8A3_PORUM|nr:hypothetical protein BU14_0166s0036 [Porphyra umbilicalis]|eukprot:OSX76996.1 hypothetical protein BU14_0166s0036 [Porphyra umbilicalis]